MIKKLVVLSLLSSSFCLGQTNAPEQTTKVPVVPCLPASDSSIETSTGPCLASSVLVPEKATDSLAVVTSVPSEITPGIRAAKPLTVRSDFEAFAESAAGRPLAVYGRKLFDQAPTTFAPIDNVPVPANYILGPGDELFIRIWGKVTLSTRVIIDRNGQIFLPKVGSLSIAGLREGQVEGFIRSAVASLYKDFELSVTLGRLRSIQIYVLGSARQPGSYTVGSLTTLVDALFASGGPSASGSMRRIQLRRNDVPVTEIDLYDVLRSGDKSHDVQLLPGDVIYIPPVGPQIAVIGSVNEAGIYELKAESTVDAALKNAGGITSLAEADRVLLERVEDHRGRRVDEFALDASGLQRPLKDGDVLRIFPISPRFENAVTIRGNVAQPGRYAWHEGMRISDLIPVRDFLITRRYWNQQNQLLRSGTIRAVDGPAADRPGKSNTDTNGNHDFDRPGMQRVVQTEDADPTPIAEIGQNTAEINWEYAVIERLDEKDLSTRLIPFRLATAIDDHSSADNQVLRAGDVITVFSRADLELPMEKHASFVRVGGEVNAPGVYRVNPGETLRDVVQESGGLTAHSYLYASSLTRVSARRAQEDQLKQSADQMQRELSSRYANAAPTVTQTATDRQAQFALQQAVISRLSGMKPTGRVVLDMKPDAASLKDIPDFPLEDGDAFYVPPRLSTVQVTGSVYNANAFRHQPGKTLSSYVNDAGGPTREADTKRIFVIRADGTVIARQSKASHYHGNIEKLKLLPGDAIVVPEKLRTPGGMRGILEVTQALSQSALTAAAMGTLLP